jgi:hypothetical protein
MGEAVNGSVVIGSNMPSHEQVEITARRFALAA